MNKYSIFTELLLMFISILCLHNHHINAGTIRIHSKTNNQGLEHELNISQCSNVPEDSVFQVKTLNTQGHCARLFEEKNCTGRSQEFMARSPYHHNIPDAWDFTNLTRSVGPCRDPCDPAVTGRIPDNPPEVMIYENAYNEGRSQFIVVEGCTRIPEYFVNRTSSILTNKYCVTLYNNPFCEYKPGYDWNSIQLHHGTPYHGNLKYHWSFSEARSISHCAHKCFDRRTVVLFDRKRYQGNWRMGTFEYNSCVNLRNYWTEISQSIKVLNGSCVKLYKTDNCTGLSQTITKSLPDMSTLQLDGNPQSMEVCNEDLTHKRTNEKEATKPPIIYTSTNNTVWSVNVLSVVIIVPILGGMIVALVVFLIMRKCNPQKVDLGKLSEKEIEEFLTGLGLALPDTGEETNQELSVELLAESRPYNEAYEVPRSQINFESNVPLGMGEFGVVFKGNITKEDQSNSEGKRKYPVAIKTLKPGSGVHLLRSLLKEVKIMLYVGKHDNIVHMMGCCTENLREGELLVLLEFCPKGSLESYLHTHRNNFKANLKGGITETSFIRNSSNEYQGLNRNSMNKSQNYENAHFLKSFEFRQMIQWCIEVASGMKFLAEAKVIHGDLAARNVLLTDNLIAKISDFGLSRQLYAYSQYVKTNQGPLPWRWIALESLKNMQFSTMSDVWSYGILCWETFTLGEKPYPGITWTSDFPTNLENGLRPTMPKYATNELYTLMSQCWHEIPERRPTFSEIIHEFKKILISYHIKSNTDNGSHQNKQYLNVLPPQ